MCIFSSTLGLHFHTKQRIPCSSKGMVTGESNYGSGFCALHWGTLLCCILSICETSAFPATGGKIGLKAKAQMQWSSGRCKADSRKGRIHGLEDRRWHPTTEWLGGIKKIPTDTKCQTEEISRSMCPAKCSCTFTAVNCSYLGLLEIPTKDPCSLRRTTL